MAEHRVPDSEFAELRGEGDMLVVSEGLFAKENDTPFEQRGANLADLTILQGLTEVDAANLGADMRGQWIDFQRPALHDVCGAHACLPLIATLRRPSILTGTSP
jgi:hypothetical protein